MVHPLDRPVWNCLNGPQAALAVLSGSVVRLDPAIGPFAAAVDAGAAAQSALAALLAKPDAQIWTVESEAWPAPPGARTDMYMPLVQMTADAVPPPDADFVCGPLGEADADDMTALVMATKPGPWGTRTWAFGGYLGVRAEGRLIAMAGTRMWPCAEWREVSAVCTDPDYRGRGLAAALIRVIAAEFARSGTRTFLHCHAENAGAIRLYEALGFRIRRQMVATKFVRA